ncbi:YlmH/Sll1252 family protein [Clostridium sp.]|uniref:YlmH family RNA-binding protein n=1 Tax=Clostridium sp. TaxID=1506 RepID=UPI00260C034C|nr:YlmH/Sll1252 family protein [Clostridium sp.]
MDKKEFLNLLNLEEYEALKLYERFNLARTRNITIFTDEFYTPDVWSTLEEINFLGVTVESFGVFKEGERRVIAFNKEEYDEYPISLLKIQCNTKFSKLEHKDYLGSIMALGINRNKIGDLILKEDGCYVAVHHSIIDFLFINLNKIKNLNCKCELIYNLEDIPKPSYEEKNIIVTSKRLDCIVAALGNMSRSKSLDIITSGSVLLDYRVTKDKSKEICEKSRLTIRGLGKFKISNIFGTTKSGRLKLTVFKYT